MFRFQKADIANTFGFRLMCFFTKMQDHFNFEQCFGKLQGAGVALGAGGWAIGLPAQALVNTIINNNSNNNNNNNNGDDDDSRR